MGDLEDQEENAPKCVLWYKSMVSRCVWVRKSPPLHQCRPRNVLQKSLLLMFLVIMLTHVTPILKAYDWAVEQISDLFSHNPQNKDTRGDQEPGSAVWRH